MELDGQEQCQWGSKGLGAGGWRRQDAPALEGVHELAGHVQALAHQAGLMAHSLEGIAEQADLVLGRGGGSHGVGQASDLAD